MISQKARVSFLILLLFPLFNNSAQETVHVVQRGDTIFSIARAYQIGQNELIRFNGISDPSRLLVGQRLRIPGTGQGTPVQQQQGWDAVHRVVRGDTLFGIARRYGVTVEELRRANNLSEAGVLREGAQLKVPGQAASAGQTTQPNEPVSPGTAVSAAARPPAGSAASLTALRWPVIPAEIINMTGRPGVEITGKKDEAVKSLSYGTVISAGPFRDYGRVVIVQADGGFIYVYGGCDLLLVHEGDRVGPGTELGRLGIDNATGKPLLKFLVYQGSRPINPREAPRA